MRVEVHQDICIGCGLCPSIEPSVFELQDDGKAHVIADPVPDGSENGALDAISSCPVNAISEKE